MLESGLLTVNNHHLSNQTIMYQEILLSFSPYLFVAGLVVGFLVGYLSQRPISSLSPLLAIPAVTSSLVAQKPSERTRYQSFHLPEERKTQYLQEILRLIETEKVYRSHEISLVKLSEKMSIPPRYISQIINEKCEVSFTEFINQYRIKEAKEILLDPDYLKFSISGIASEVGFSSRQSFHQAFKRFTGTTPAKFRESCQDSRIPTYSS